MLPVNCGSPKACYLSIVAVLKHVTCQLWQS